MGLLLLGLPPVLEVCSQLLFCQPQPLQLGLHQPARFQQPLVITEIRLLGQGHIEPNGSPMSRDLDRGDRFQVGGQARPKLTYANTDSYNGPREDVYNL